MAAQDGPSNTTRGLSRQWCEYVLDHHSDRARELVRLIPDGENALFWCEVIDLLTHHS